MKIAYMVSTFPSISQTFVLREIQGLVARGCEVEVFAIQRQGGILGTQLFHDASFVKRAIYSRPDSLLQNGVANLVALVLHPRRYLSILWLFVGELWRVEPRKALGIMYRFYCGIGVGSMVRKGNISHIHGHFQGAEIALAASLFTNIPFSWTAHASGDIYWKPVLLRAKLRHCSFIAAVSHYNKRYLDSTCPGSEEKIHVVPNGVYLSEAASSAAVAPRRRADVFRIVSVGRLTPVKGFHTLIETSELLTHRGYRIECTIVGGGEEEGSLRRMIINKGLGDVVHLSGCCQLSEIYAELSRSDVFVLLSEIGISGYRDGLPTVVIEAMLMGLPVVSTYVSAIPELVSDGVTGFLVPERNPSEAADVLEHLITNPGLGTAFGMAGRKKVETDFNADTNVNRLLALMTSVNPTARSEPFDSRGLVR